MFYKTRFLLSTFLVCFALVACDNNEAPQATSDKIVEQQVAEVAEIETATETTAINKIEAGMSEKTVTELLGDATIIQTRTLDSLTITHSEWTDKAGTISVQFLNGKVQFSQFTPSNK